MKSPPDGYTMLLVNPANGINTTLYKNLPFDFMRDIAPVAGLVRAPNVMEVNNAFPARNVAEFIAYCKANPGKINMASSGSGTSVHLSGELFKFMTGCDMLHVPFKGAGPALVELMSGQVHVIFDNLPSSAPHLKGGRIRALAVTSAEREPSLPGVPTVAETVPGYEATAWFGIGMPKGTPAEIIEKVSYITRERFRLKRQIQVHTAQGRLTGWILTLLPVVLGIALVTAAGSGFRRRRRGLGEKFRQM